MESDGMEPWKRQRDKEDSDSAVAIDGVLWESVVFLFASVSIRHNGMFRLEIHGVLTGM